MKVPSIFVRIAGKKALAATAALALFLGIAPLQAASAGQGAPAGQGVPAGQNVGDLAGPSGAPLPVGRIITDRGPVCTGVLIGRYAVLTAAHCLVTRAGDGFFSSALIHFALYPPDGNQLYAKAAERHVAPDYPLPASVDPEALAHDWAVVILADPLGDTVPPARLVTGEDWRRRGLARRPGTLTVVAFGRARTLRPTVRRRACALLDPAGDLRHPALIHHDCIVERGSSGSVLLGLSGGDVLALAVNVAVRRGGAARTVATLLPETVRAFGAREPDPLASINAWESPFARRTKDAPWSRPQ
ncbi:MAG: trypsin-like serine peptidase [Alphaproteobacteria bacterium]